MPSINEMNDERENQYLNWLISVKEKLGIQKESLPKFGIYTVPRNALKIDEDPYSPHTVSIGPLHRGKHDFMIGEELKWRYASHFFYRTESPVHALEECANAIRKIASEARDSYAATLNFTEMELIEMFLIDGCFMLELFIRYSSTLELKNDPLLQNRRLFKDIQRDLAILENQIPFTILLTLFDSVHKFLNDKRPLHMYALKFFSSVINLSEIATDQTCRLLTEKNIEHILDMLHLVYCSSYVDNMRVLAPSQQSLRTDQNSGELPEPVMYVEGEYVRVRGLALSAIRLKKYGIRFQIGDSEQLVSFEFVNGILKIPPLKIDRRTNAIFRNLIAFEQFHSESSYMMSSYVILMSDLMQSSQDVRLLRDLSIIYYIGDDEDIVSLFEGLSMEANVGRFKYYELCDDIHTAVVASPGWSTSRMLNEFKKFLGNSVAALKYEYFKNMWTSLSVVAAIILLVLTALQTIYTLLDYYHRF